MPEHTQAEHIQHQHSQAEHIQAGSGRRSSDVTVIDCDDCIGPSIGACDDCVVTFLCEREPDDAIVIDVAEERALRMLADADLVPRLRHVRVGRDVS